MKEREEAPTEGVRSLRSLVAGMQEVAHQVERELVGFEHLVGCVLAYAQTLPGYDPAALLDLATHPLRAGEWSLDDPALSPFERLEAVLRSQQGSPVLAQHLPREARRGFPYPTMLRRAIPSETPSKP